MNLERWRADNNRVEGWRDSLEIEIQESSESRRRRLERGELLLPSIEERFERREIEGKTVLELLSRGLDSKATRLFRGRISLTVRCRKRGHILAHVYPTSLRPIVVPRVAGVNPEHKEGRFKNVDALKEWRVNPAAYEALRLRDPWITESTDWEFYERLCETFKGETGRRLAYLKATYFDLQGMAILEPRLRQKVVTVEGVRYEPYWSWLCRCGEHRYPCYRLMAALDEGVPQDFAG
ncbi:hypothetical protein ACFXGI_18595 [Streptomyces sp. NPDC059355]|uniref:hypothetical protein n=1 Tax=Streptomyces sp. NPDC059355 TaxID=3346811 RepID=UPI0036757817